MMPSSLSSPLLKFFRYACKGWFIHVCIGRLWTPSIFFLLKIKFYHSLSLIDWFQTYFEINQQLDSVISVYVLSNLKTAEFVQFLIFHSSYILQIILNHRQCLWLEVGYCMLNTPPSLQCFIRCSESLLQWVNVLLVTSSVKEGYCSLFFVKNYRWFS